MEHGDAAVCVLAVGDDELDVGGSAVASSEVAEGEDAQGSQQAGKPAPGFWEKFGERVLITS